jgi:hypothetical protein
VETLIALQYPNGRIHETAVDRQLRRGERFEMYGRTWTTADQAKRARRREKKGKPRTLCVPATYEDEDAYG